LLLTIAVVNSVYIKMKYSISLAQNSTAVAIFFNRGRSFCTPEDLVTGCSVIELPCAHSIQKLQPNWKKKSHQIDLTVVSISLSWFLMKKNKWQITDQFSCNGLQHGD